MTQIIQTWPDQNPTGDTVERNIVVAHSFRGDPHDDGRLYPFQTIGGYLVPISGSLELFYEVQA